MGLGCSLRGLLLGRFRLSLGLFHLGDSRRQLPGRQRGHGLFADGTRFADLQLGSEGMSPVSNLYLGPPSLGLRHGFKRLLLDRLGLLHRRAKAINRLLVRLDALFGGVDLGC